MGATARGARGLRMRLVQLRTRRAKYEKNVLNAVGSTALRSVALALAVTGARGHVGFAKNLRYTRDSGAKHGKRGLLRKARRMLSTAKAVDSPQRTWLHVEEELSLLNGGNMAAKEQGLAGKYNLSTTTVRRVLWRGADFLIASQVALLRKVSAWIQEKRPTLDFGFAAVMFDETGQKLHLSTRDGPLNGFWSSLDTFRNST